MSTYALRRRSTGPNVGTSERVVRAGAGGLLAVLGVALLMSGDASAWSTGLHAAVVALGADFLVTGLTGNCPLYRWLGWSTARPQDA